MKEESSEFSVADSGECQDTTINFGSANSNDMMTALQDSFITSSSYDSQLAMSDGLDENNFFYNHIDI